MISNSEPTDPCPTCGWTGPQTQYLGLDGTEISHPAGEHVSDWLPRLLARTHSTESWATAPDGEEFRAGECQGHDACPVKTHEHGCFADTGNCDHPEEHESSGPESELSLRNYNQEVADNYNRVIHLDASNKCARTRARPPLLSTYRAVF